MRKHLVLLGAISMAAVLFAWGCNGGPSSSFKLGGLSSGSLSILAGDAPLCDVTGFTVTVTGATLTPSSGGTPVVVVSSSNPVTLNFASLMDFETALSLLDVPTGSYSRLDLTLSNPQITTLDTTQSPPKPTTVQASLPSLSLSIPINPALTVTQNAASSVQMELNLLQSIQTDSSGNVTGSVSPVLTAAVASSTASSFGELQDLKGIVQSVSTTSSNPSFAGSFTLLLPTGVTAKINVSANPPTQFVPSTAFPSVSSGLAGLVPGSTFVEVDASVDLNNNVVASNVAIEAQENAAQNIAAFTGLVTSVTRNTSGNTTAFTLLVRSEAPDLSTVIPVEQNVTVSLNSGTAFSVSDPLVNQGNLQFTPATLGVGEEVAVHGTAQAGSPPSVAASSVWLSLQSVVGSFSTSPVPNDQGTVASFSLAPCSTLYGSGNLTAVTFNTPNLVTAFPGVNGNSLSGLTTSGTLVVKGEVFFEPTVTTATVSTGGALGLAPGTVIEADQVHQLP